MSLTLPSNACISKYLTYGTLRTQTSSIRVGTPNNSFYTAHAASSEASRYTSFFSSTEKGGWTSCYYM